jgi:general secretion pathway protein L
MLAGFFSWWFTRLTELLPSTWTSSAVRGRDGIVIDVDDSQSITASSRRNGRYESLTLGVAARLASRKPVLLRPPAETVLTKVHVVPAAPRRQLDQLLRHELVRITPFPADALFWRWQGHAKPGDTSRLEIVFTMVPKLGLSTALRALDDLGIRPDFVEVQVAGRPALLPFSESPQRSGGTALVRGLSWACAVLVAAAVLLPVVMQAITLNATETAIAELQPTIAQVDALRRGISANDAGKDILAREAERTGDVLQILATITRILPDDTFLTDFALRERQMTLSGRSASAPRLITGLSGDPAIRNTAFAAPVTRIEGATSDIFSIKAEIAR